MEKYAIFVAGILLVISLILVVIMILPSLTGAVIANSEKTLKTHAWTKAICDKDNFCQDYLIECNGQEPAKLSPITGSSIKFDPNWQDPRTLEQRERLC